MQSGTGLDIAKFYSPPEREGPLRRDLHSRWSRNGKGPRIDSAHTGEGRNYDLDVGAITGKYH